jgi:hypothetical protein
MEFTEIKIYDVIEEQLVDGQLLCEVQSDINNVSYSVDSSYNQYFSVIENKVFLTGEGKAAINLDNPEDISQELNYLNFNIIGTDLTTDSSIVQNVSVKITRIIDNPPYVLSHFEHMLYTQNLYPNQRVAHIELVYNTFCNIVGLDASYFNIDPIPSTGSNSINISLNNNGINKYQNLDFSTLNADDIEVIENKKIYKKEIILELIDATNNKSLVFSIFLNIVEGSQYNEVPVKNNLEIQAELLATKISDIVVKNQEDINTYSFDIGNLKQRVSTVGSQLNLSRAQINEIRNLLDENITENKEVFKFQDDKIKVIVESNDEMYNVIYGTISNYLKTNTNSDLENKALAFNEINTNEFRSYANEVLSKGFSEYLLARTDIEIQRRFENFTDTVNEMMVSFRTLINSNIISPFNVKTIELASGINTAFVEISKLGTMTSTMDAHLNQAEVNINSLDSRTQVMESYTLEDWGTSTGWKFNANNIIYKNIDVVSYSNTGTTLYNSNKIILSTGDGAAYWDGDLLTFDNASEVTVDAGTFTGTSTRALYADLAEYYKKEINEEFEYLPGQILYINRAKAEQDFEVTLNGKGNIYCGVITTDPGFILNNGKAEDPEYVCIALTGRVPVICNASAGMIKKGMYLYPNVQKPNTAEGTFTFRNSDDLIGIALENSDIATVDAGEDFKILCKVK